MNANQKQTQKTGSTDSLFGMALAQAFTGLAFGIGVEQLWEAGEMASAVHEDRYAAKAQTRTNDQSFELGVRKSLSGVFAGLHQSARQTIAEMDRATFKPSFAAAPSFSTPAFN